MADVIKDRTGVHPNEILEDPTLIDWQVVIDGNKGKKDFVLKNSLDTAVQTEQEIYSAEVMSNAAKSMSKSDMKKAMSNIGDEVEKSSSELIDEINGLMKKLAVPERQVITAKLKENDLPDTATKIKSTKDTETLTQILSVVKANI